MIDLAVLRKSVSEQRRSLQLLEVERLSHQISEKLIEFCSSHWEPSEWVDAIVGSYRVTAENPAREVNPKMVSSHPYFSSAIFAYPRVKSLADGTMDFVPAAHESDWVDGALGLSEPRPELISLQPSELFMVICPGVVFDEYGARVGRGRGFYDRYLAKAKGAFRVGIAYDFQISAQPIPVQPHDQRVDAVITESRILTFPPRS